MGNAELRDVMTNAMIETICSAARKLTGFERREFQAEVAIQYCEGSARKAERIFGWGRSAVSTGLSEKRTGMRCVDAFQLRGRKKSQVAAPQLGSEICGIEDFTVQSDATLEAEVADIEIPASQMEASLMGIDPAPTNDSTLKFDRLILSRSGNSLRRALTNRNREQ